MRDPTTPLAAALALGALTLVPWAADGGPSALGLVLAGTHAKWPHFAASLALAPLVAAALAALAFASLRFARHSSMALALCTTPVVARTSNTARRQLSTPCARSWGRSTSRQARPKILSCMPTWILLLRIQTAWCACLASGSLTASPRAAPKCMGRSLSARAPSHLPRLASDQTKTGTALADGGKIIR